jgi:hypothetical protein
LYWTMEGTVDRAAPGGAPAPVHLQRPLGQGVDPPVDEASLVMLREQTLKKLLVKICLRVEVERFRSDPSCWRNGEDNPLLWRTFRALRSSPLLRDAALGDDTFERFLAALPTLAAELQGVDGKDLLITLANDLGNMLTLVLVTDNELNGAPFDAELLDDVEREEGDGSGGAIGGDNDSNFNAGARRLREQSMRSFKVALADIRKMEGGFQVAYHNTIHAASLDAVAPPSVQTALVHAFDSLEFVITDGVLIDDVRREDFRHKAAQMSNPLLGMLLNAANPFRYLPTFVRLAFRTGIAERLVLREATRKLAQLRRAVSDGATARAIVKYVDRGVLKLPVTQIKSIHLELVVTVGAHEQEAALQFLKQAVLVWQKRRLMQLLNRPEFAFFLNELVPMLGSPLAALYQELHVGNEIKQMGAILEEVAQFAEGALQRLRLHIFEYVSVTLRNDSASKLKENIFWLVEGLSDPHVIPLMALVQSHVPAAEQPALWREVDDARTLLKSGSHFQNLSLPTTRLLAQHFHRQLIMKTK